MFADIFADKSDNFFLDPQRYIRQHDICNIGRNRCAFYSQTKKFYEPLAAYIVSIKFLCKAHSYNRFSSMAYEHFL